MPSAVFLIQLDENHGFILKKRYPTSLKVTEADLNNIYVPHADKFGLHVINLDGRKILSYSKKKMPEWVICFEMETDDDISYESTHLEGTARLLLELAETSVEDINLEDIMKSGSSLSQESQEQKYARVFLTPSAPLILERMQKRIVTGAVELSMWLKNEVGDDGIDIVEAITPLTSAGILEIEMITRTKQYVFLVKDLFGYRAPPTQSMKLTEMTYPEIHKEYVSRVDSFFSPDESGRGYNPTIVSGEESQPIIEDREKIAENVANTIHYNIISVLRKGPLSIEEIVIETAFPKSIVTKALWALQSNSIVTSFDDETIWALLTNPIFDCFMPEYVAPIIANKWNEENLDAKVVVSYLEHLINSWRTKS
ncbi:MAG: hypothetical protein GF411_10210 [Candidatus Lokiarchaeota archaeon]|nr:hypothetical protein [Candidatus Lokiarchaeota archaeon]